MTTGVTFDEIAESADRAFAYALLARLAKSYILSVYRSREVAAALERLTAILIQSNVDRLIADKSDHSTKLKARLQELHQELAILSRSEEAETIRRLPLFASHIDTIREKTEDLGDIVDAIAFAENDDFKNLVKCFGSSMGIQEPEDAIGRMHS